MKATASPSLTTYTANELTHGVMYQVFSTPNISDVGDIVIFIGGDIYTIVSTLCIPFSKWGPDTSKYVFCEYHGTVTLYSE